MISNPFDRAAKNLVTRYYRRHPEANWAKWDVTGVKSRWYRRGFKYIAAIRTRLSSERFKSCSLSTT